MTAQERLNTLRKRVGTSAQDRLDALKEKVGAMEAPTGAPSGAASRADMIADSMNRIRARDANMPTYESVLNEPQISQALRTIQEKETAQNQQAIDAIYSRMITAISENPELIDNLILPGDPFGTKEDLIKRVEVEKQLSKQQQESYVKEQFYADMLLPTAEEQEKWKQANPLDKYFLYPAAKYATGFYSAPEDVVGLLTQTAGDIATGGKTSDDYQKIGAYFAEKPETLQGALMNSSLVPFLAEEMGVDDRNLKFYLSTSRSQMLNDFAENEVGKNLNPTYKKWAGGLAYTLGQQTPAMLIFGLGARSDALIDASLLEDTSAETGMAGNLLPGEGNAGKIGVTVTKGTGEVAKVGDDFGKLGVLVEDSGLKADWASTTLHGTTRMAERGVTQSMVDIWVADGKVLKQSSGNYLFITKDGIAVLNQYGELVTTYTKAEFDANMWKVVMQLFGE
jgi:hypothetical protein